ncbi:hypothetical protein P153DRAFT_146803 [Dothidotthia symphoricarpi CBS 119687]|uniref:Uncharacterized protein n=1 Tax=Dothidotthia symphoricarpi CBS 119687 TaxID=1392245 RepID=A0A6A5ZXP6_9PLEO|nr:uncharacterized protein P153DRAFT_146803 [Dothidotthia symphoricarpi CBS 119687]KAF2123795.1 hypothetical protein P153DRAFT_146803 [Dothidotthia symphoricarpi CBS 119687]
MGAPHGRCTCGHGEASRRTRAWTSAAGPLPIFAAIAKELCVRHRPETGSTTSSLAIQCCASTSPVRLPTLSVGNSPQPIVPCLGKSRPSTGLTHFPCIAPIRGITFSHGCLLSTTCSAPTGLQTRATKRLGTHMGQAVRWRCVLESTWDGRFIHLPSGWHLYRGVHPSGLILF